MLGALYWGRLWRAPTGQYAMWVGHLGASWMATTELKVSETIPCNSSAIPSYTWACLPCVRYTEGVREQR